MVNSIKLNSKQMEKLCVLFVLSIVDLLVADTMNYFERINVKSFHGYNNVIL